MKNDRIFITSDHHFCHERIISICGRPFADVEEMNETLASRWNSVVGKNGVVYHLGDFCLGNREQIQGWFKRLNGRIRLIVGNHDRYKPRDYLAVGFDRVYEYPICVRGFYWLSHAPMFLPVNSCYANVHGHIHQADYSDSFHFNACVEKTDYAPVLFDDVVGIFEEKLAASVLSEENRKA